MVCKKCGKVNPNYNQICCYCGGELLARGDLDKKEKKEYSKNSSSKQESENKGAIGVFLGLFLGLLGLIIGLLMYPANTKERETFFSGWLGAFIIGLLLVGGIVLLCFIMLV